MSYELLKIATFVGNCGFKKNFHLIYVDVHHISMFVGTCANVCVCMCYWCIWDRKDDDDNLVFQKF